MAYIISEVSAQGCPPGTFNVTHLTSVDTSGMVGRMANATARRKTKTSAAMDSFFQLTVAAE